MTYLVKTVKNESWHGDAAAVLALRHYALIAVEQYIGATPFIGLNPGREITFPLLGYGRLARFYTLDIMVFHVPDLVGMHRT